MCAGDNRFSIIATLFLPVIGWVRSRKRRLWRCTFLCMQPSCWSFSGCTLSFLARFYTAVPW